MCSQLRVVQLSLQHKDAEIQRLSAKLASDGEINLSTLSLRNETNEAIIISLNQQVGSPSDGLYPPSPSPY